MWAQYSMRQRSCCVLFPCDSQAFPPRERRPTPLACAWLMAAHVALGNEEAALSIARLMESLGMPPPLGEFAQVVKAHVAMGKTKEVRGPSVCREKQYYYSRPWCEWQTASGSCAWFRIGSGSSSLVADEEWAFFLLYFLSAGTLGHVLGRVWAVPLARCSLLLLLLLLSRLPIKQVP